MDISWAICVWICVIGAAHANVKSKVKCRHELMEVDIIRTSPQARIYLHHLKNYPDEGCQPQIKKGIATFRLSILDRDLSRCGMTRVLNKLTGQKVYYHQIVVEEPSDSSKHTLTVKCVITEVAVQPGINFGNYTFIPSNHSVVRRNVLPAGFQEEEHITDAASITQSAPSPELGIGVRQNGVLVTGELSVSPGTPLQMEIYLKPDSAPTYGLLVTHMQVRDKIDNATQEEAIIFNGCSVDPYLFENFNTVDGDFLTAKFRAFKFPDSNYVQFRGTVNVCLDKCDGVECSNGQIGYGRRRRSIKSSKNQNQLYEVTMSTFVRVGEGSAEYSEFIVKGRSNRTGEEQSVITEEVREKFQYKVSEVATNGSSVKKMVHSILLVCIYTILLT
ncbi:uncharacterized protein LOC122500930 [Leptopilina heterotoma]|uniref:uncharacterized protein LOC122500930 n=1 Tax=Leptopilina heterotoma TaxID=63436 RepID=UPI001CA7C6FC|nr:uncharacterized protein LOC122500930 [Leptopilina heterotoma]